MKENNIGTYFNDFSRWETENGERVQKHYFGLFSSRFDMDLEKKNEGHAVKLDIVLSYLQTVKRTSEFKYIFHMINGLNTKLDSFSEIFIAPKDSP